MPTTFIDTNQLPRRKTAQGEVIEILNGELAGARNVLGLLRWLQSSEKFEAQPAGRHQLLYLMDGKGSIHLDGKEYAVSRGEGIYLGPSEAATIQAAEGVSLKLLHLIVPRIPK